MGEELRRQYHLQMGLVEERVRHLFALVTDGISAATEALLFDNASIAWMLSAREALIDELYRECENLVVEQLALQAPVANELRYFLAVLRLVPELERSHDLVEHIARRGTRGLGERLSPRARGLVERMGRLGTEMWQITADAWSARDLAAIAAVSRRDDEMDELRAALVAEVARGSVEIPLAMDMALVARFYERLGDHAVNVGERVRSLAVAPPAPDGLGAVAGGAAG